MKTFLSRCAFALGAAGLLSGGTLPVQAQSISTLYSFTGTPDGALPDGGLSWYQGGLYGSTRFGGTFDKGTVFRVDAASGAETILYNIPGKKDGSEPLGALARKGTMFYGLNAKRGGKFDHGTLFEVDSKTGQADVLYHFSTAGYSPQGMAFIGGKLVGTTRYGGASNYGVIFSIDPGTGDETVLHSFTGTDGMEPFAPVIQQGGTLFGTTALGGASNHGTVFAFDPATGNNNILYNFAGGSDGTYPLAPLLFHKGLLYGTTEAGGQGSCEGGLGCGTLYSVDPTTGAENILYRFAGGKNDGGVPLSLIAVAGVLYGTTSQGGRYCGHDGCGTIFKFDPQTGRETMLHAFDGTDGATPVPGALVYENGAFYGATIKGGEARKGTVFKFVD